MTSIAEFNLWDNARFQSGWILTSLKLTKEEVSERQKRVVWILENYSWIQVDQTENWLWIDFSNSGKHHIPRIIRLLEESTILQDASDYLWAEQTAQWSNIWDITQTIVLLKLQMMNSSSKKVNIYSFVDINIWEIIFDLKSDIHRWIFQPTDIETKEIEWLEWSRESFLRFFNQVREAIMIW
jgi:hypothetical protein